MAEPREHEDVCLIVGMLSAFPELFDRAMEALSETYGPVARESGLFGFDFTRYYEREMGSGIMRKFCSFERPIRPERLPEIKLHTNALEKRLATGCPVPRPINLDPGYLTHSKLVLATTKDYAHRIYLGRGIFAEVTLIYRDGEYRPTPWTYPDYRTEWYRRFFKEVRTDVMRARGRSE